MSVVNSMSGERITDIYGHPLSDTGEMLLKALDKALTLEAYYSSTHEQYILATDEAAQVISRGIRAVGTVVLEITAEGLLVLQQTVAPDHRHIKQLLNLLMPLNVARLELDATLSPGDLRQALESLQTHRQKLGKGESFREIKIENLPPTIRATSRSVLREHEVNSRKRQKESDPDEYESEGEKLARRFLAMVNEVLNNLKNLGVAEMGDQQGGHQVSLSAADLEDLRLSLKRLLEFNPTPRELAGLISHARRALELSRDPYRTDLVFQILRRDILCKEPMGPESHNRALKGQTEYSLSMEELQAEVARLNSLGQEAVGPYENAGKAHLAICLTMLQDNPTEAIKQSIHSSLVNLLKRPGMNIEHLEPCLQAVSDALEAGFMDWVGILLETTTMTLRKGRPELLGPFWATLAERTDDGDLEMVWPYLVNDILLGLGRSNGQANARALSWAGSIKPSSARRLVADLERMGSLEREKGAGDLFSVSPVTMLPVLQALARTRLAPWISKGLFVSMRARPVNRLTKVLMQVVDYHPSLLDFYLDLVAQPAISAMSEKLRGRAAFLLLDTLDSLSRTEREEDWVVDAMHSLAELKVEDARLLFEKVVSERRMMFGYGWPQECRAIAEEALAEIAPAGREVHNG